MPGSSVAAATRTRNQEWLPRNYCVVLALTERLRQSGRTLTADGRITAAEVVREMFDVSEMLYGKKPSAIIMSPNTTYRALTELEERGYLLRVRDDEETGGHDSFRLTDLGIARAPQELTVLSGRRNPPIPPDPQLILDWLRGRRLRRI